jgi:hypothetical protein
MSRTETIKTLKEELVDLIAQLTDELYELELSKSESDHWNDIQYGLQEELNELDYLIASMDAADDRDVYDEDGNLENDDTNELDGSIW